MRGRHKLASLAFLLLLQALAGDTAAIQDTRDTLANLVAKINETVSNSSTAPSGCDETTRAGTLGHLQCSLASVISNINTNILDKVMQNQGQFWLWNIYIYFDSKFEGPRTFSSFCPPFCLKVYSSFETIPMP